MRMTPWKQLIVSTGDTEEGETLGEMCENSDSLLRATVEHGRITAWPQLFLSAPGEEPDWDTPKAPVDWRGFEAEYNRIAGEAFL